MLGVARDGSYNPKVLHALEKLVGLDGAPARFWLTPSAVLIATVAAFVLIGQITAAPLYVSVPNGLVIAFVMAGLTVACMIPGGSDAPRDDPPRGDDDSPVLGSPGGPWMVVAHLGPPAPDDAEGSEQLVPALSRSEAADPR